MKKASLIMCAVSLVFATHAMADYTVTQSTSAPSYSNTLDFDEPGGPTGIIAANAFAGIGITELQAGDGQPVVGNFNTPTEPWLPDNNAFFGNFGVFLTFANDLTGFSAQIWDPSGPPSPFGGGLGVFVFDDGVQVADFVGEPAWGGIGDEWFDVSATNGMVFDEVRILGFGFIPTTYADNLSWENAPAAIPEPGSFGLMFMAAAALAVRRRK